MRGTPVNIDVIGHPESLLLKVSFEVGTSISDGRPISLLEMKSQLEKQLENVEQDRFLKIALTFIIDEIEYAIANSGQSDALYPDTVSASWDRCMPGAVTRIYYPPFDDPTEIVV